MYDNAYKEILNKEQIDELIIKYKNSGCKDKEILAEIVESHIVLIKKLVIKEITKAKKNDKYEDYLQEAILQFINCVKNYDANNENGASLSTYACNCIPGCLKKYTYNMEAGPLNLRKNQYRKYLQGLIFEDEYFDKHNELPTDEQVAEQVGISVNSLKKYKHIFSGYTNVKSLNTTVQRDGENPVELQDNLIDDSTLIEKQIENKLFIQKCFDSIKNDTYKKILYMYYFEEISQKQIAEILNLSQVSVSRIMKRTLNEIREKMGVA